MGAEPFGPWIVLAAASKSVSQDFILAVRPFVHSSQVWNNDIGQLVSWSVSKVVRKLWFQPLVT